MSENGKHYIFGHFLLIKLKKPEEANSLKTENNIYFWAYSLDFYRDIFTIPLTVFYLKTKGKKVKRYDPCWIVTNYSKKNCRRIEEGGQLCYTFIKEENNFFYLLYYMILFLLSDIILKALT